MQYIRIRRGQTFPVTGAAPNLPVPRHAGQAALLGADYPGIKAALAVTEGQRVAIGDVLFTDRTQPLIRFCAPANGVVSAIHRGPRRSLQAIVITVEDGGMDTSVSSVPARHTDPAAVRATLLEKGLWPALRSRPMDIVPPPDDEPDALFVTAMDTRPGAADANGVIGRHAEAFAAGLEALSVLAPRTFVCVSPQAEISCPDQPGMLPVVFEGPHPAGLPGTHIHYLASPGSRVWHIGYQDVIAIGRLFADGCLSVQREVATGGAVTPELLSTRLGASLQDLVSGPADAYPGSFLEPPRDPLSDRFLGRYHNQLWTTAPANGPQARSSWRHLLRASRQDGRAGPAWRTGMLTLEAFDAVWPLSTPPVPLLRALLTEDIDAAAALGANMLAEEDLALCSYVCPAKLDYGRALRTTLHTLSQAGGL